MHEKQNKHYTFNVFPDHTVRNVIFRFLFTRLEKGRGNPNLFLFGHVCFVTDAANLRSHILNIDQLEMNHV